jgi:5'(3')-deoxyribonucleotidase
MKTVFVDVDDVCALLHLTWLGHYNLDYHDNLTDKDMTDWDTSRIVKPECGIKIYDYLKDPKLYNEVIPREGAVEGVNALRELGYRVVFPTATPIESAGRKFYWLRKWGFIEDRKDYIEISDKSLLNGHFMLDDSYDNIAGFRGMGFLFSRPWNISKSWSLRVDSWEEFIDIMGKDYIRAEWLQVNGL